MFIVHVYCICYNLTSCIDFAAAMMLKSKSVVGKD